MTDTPRKWLKPGTATVTRNSSDILARRTLPSNTGYDSQPIFQVGIDWLDISFRNAGDLKTVESLISAVERITGDSIDFCSTKAVFNGRMWDGSGNGLKGTRVWFDAGCSDDGHERPVQLKVAMPGSVMAEVQLETLVAWLVPAGAKYDLDCTRIDLCLDDKEKNLDLGKITEAHMRGDFFNVSYSNLENSGKRKQDKGVAVYFGSPSSTKRLVFYDKSIESGGKVEGIRAEARFRKQDAATVLLDSLEALSHDTQDFIQFAVNTILGVVDFRNRSSDDKNRFRCPVLSWYSDFIRIVRASPVRVRTELKTECVQRSIDWIKKSVAQSLALVQNVLDSDFPEWLETTISQGAERLSIKRRELAERTDKNLLLFDTQ